MKKHPAAFELREAQRADGGHGLWSRDTPWGETGYYIDYGYDLAATSFHVLTTGGIRGRDVLGN